VTNLGLEVPGTFRAFSGSIQFDPTNLESSSMEVSIPVKSINTANRMRDEHLQEEEFFDAANHPAIKFTSQSITKDGHQYLATGTLMIKGKSQSVSIPFSYDGATFHGKLSLKRSDFGVGGNGYLNTISDQVNIQLTCVLSTD
jgi:polyisoprenoid-binding protein YceI